jgi:hypothetical protein
VPRKAAAEMYSLLIAEAFHHGVTERAATRKSDVVRAGPPRPNEPTTATAPSTAVTAVSVVTTTSTITNGSPGR